METDGQLKNILVIEDSQSDANLVRLMLEANERYCVEVVGSMAEAASAVERQFPDLILLDLHLPDADGVEAVEAAMELVGVAPIVVLTGSDDESLAIAALKRGAQDYVNKNEVNAKLLQRVLRHAEERQHLVQELRATQERLEQQTRSDPLTALLNRRGLKHELEYECRQARRSGQSLHVVGWDLDDFKAINDRYGHATGDELLVCIADRARQAFRESDTIARIGGDEFMALLRGARSAEAAIVAERLRDSVSEPHFQLGGQSIAATVSVGVVEVCSESSNIGELLRAVDVALYRSKHAGKNRVSFCGPMEADDTAEQAAPPTDEIHFVAEPMSDPATDLPGAYELLLRLDETGDRAPSDFFAASRRANRLTLCDIDVLERAVRASAELEPGVTCHLNLFPSTIREYGATALGAILERAGDRRFCIDVSEQQIVGDPSLLGEALAPLREMGHQIGLDHIGSSRSSLETLLAIDPDVVKVDVSWTCSLNGDRGRRRELEKLLRILSVSGSVLVVARPSSSNGCESLLEIAKRAGVQFLWSEPTRSIRLGSSERLREPSPTLATSGPVN